MMVIQMLMVILTLMVNWLAITPALMAIRCALPWRMTVAYDCDIDVGSAFVYDSDVRRIPNIFII